MTFKIEHISRLGQKVGEQKAKHYFEANNRANNVITDCRSNPACQIRDIYIVNEITGATIKRTV